MHNERARNLFYHLADSLAFRVRLYLEGMRCYRLSLKKQILEKKKYIYQVHQNVYLNLC